MRKPLKRWSVNAVARGNTPLTFFCDDVAFEVIVMGDKRLDPTAGNLLNSISIEKSRRVPSRYVPWRIRFICRPCSCQLR